MPESEQPLLFSPVHRRWALKGERAQSVAEQAAAEVTEGLDLFQHHAADSGYERWKSEAVQARAEAVAARRAEELPMQADDAGYAAWKTEAEKMRLAFEQRWGVPLGKTLRVLLRGETLEREGRLSMVEDAAARKSGAVLRLRLDGELFEAGRIVSVVRIG